MEVLPILLGVLAGTFTGLVPGVHVNLLATVTLSLGAGAEAVPFLVALALTHTFMSSIPSILLGAPESEMALGVLPGHRYLLKGLGYMAIKLTLYGSLMGFLLALALIPLWWKAIALYNVLVRFMGWVLLAVSAYMIARDNRRGWALLVYLAAGALGLLVLRRPLVADPLFPMLSGLFGTSTLLYSLTQRSGVPEQRIEADIKIRPRDAARALVSGNLSGFIASMLPGLGSAQAAVLGMKFAGRIGDHGVLILLGAISTVNFALSLLTWLSLGKARNGAVVAIQQLTAPTPETVIGLFAVAAVAAGISTALGLWLSRLTIRVINSVPYRPMLLSVVLSIIALVAALTGPRGLLVLLTATGIGFVPAVTRCSRAHAMGCLMLPVALFFL